MQHFIAGGQHFHIQHCSLLACQVKYYNAKRDADEEENLAQQEDAAPEGLEAGAGADVWAVGDGVIAVAIFARQVQVTVAGLDAKRTHNGPAGADVGFLVAINAAGERIRRVVIIAVQAEAVADFPLQAAADRGRITFIALFRLV